MATEYCKEVFLNAKGRRTVVGERAPDESADNLNQYRELGLIGPEAVVEAATGKDVGRKGRAATRKPVSETAKD